MRSNSAPHFARLATTRLYASTAASTSCVATCGGATAATALGRGGAGGARAQLGSRLREGEPRQAGCRASFQNHLAHRVRHRQRARVAVRVAGGCCAPRHLSLQADICGYETAEAAALIRGSQWC